MIIDVGVVSPGPTLDAVVDVCSGKGVAGGASVVAVVVKSGFAVVVSSVFSVGKVLGVVTVATVVS